MNVSSAPPVFVHLAEYNYGQLGTIKTTVHLPWNPVIYCLIAAFHAVTYWMCLELTIHLFYTFNRRSTLYFWSILVSICSIISMTILLELIIFVYPLTELVVLGVQRTLTSITYVAFIMVLYSRLHLVTRNRVLLRGVIYTIIVIALFLNIPNVVLLCVPKMIQRPSLFQTLYYFNVVVGAQEIVLSTMYIYLFYKFARAGSFEQRDRGTFLLLILAQLIIVITDVAMIVLICIRYNLLRMMLVPFTYALKLRLEFLVLNRLAGPERSRQRIRDRASNSGDNTSWYAGWTKFLTIRQLRRVEQLGVAASEVICEEKSVESNRTTSIRPVPATALRLSAWDMPHSLFQNTSWSDTDNSYHGSDSLDPSGLESS
ncbi:hypothetical protein EJ08DRAFT_375765 [Tothia fuscella]|uniref:DUF7703 domain-containing protein n=1 Tax=Tothia fuscella TaxID=1048955 RepID=A0A9P4TUX4_9PEZI|nr:hypothetical protein EJ08DRAFT_375765 [Tothia fuscella]